MTGYDNLYKEWSGETTACNSVKHDIAEAIDFAEYCVNHYLSEAVELYRELLKASKIPGKFKQSWLKEWEIRVSEHNKTKEDE